jgi:phosphoenolpyruvate carboxylase
VDEETVVGDAAELLERLGELHGRTADTPLFNPVFQLSLELSRELESGLGLSAIEDLVAQIEHEALSARAERLRSLIEPLDDMENLARFAHLCSQPSDFDEFNRRWNRPLLGLVFTAHPTFLLTPDEADVVASLVAGEVASGMDDACPAKAGPITLEEEHEQALAALFEAGRARDRLNRVLLEAARRQWPERWLAFDPTPFRFATWVGYDMDGRTDISWATSVGFRLKEKALRLAGYTAALAAIEPRHPELLGLERAVAYSSERAADFSRDLTDPEVLSKAANSLSSDHPDKWLSLGPLIARLENEARTADPDRAVDLRVLSASMRADGLGVGWIHFRVNSSQLHNAIRLQLKLGESADLGSRSALIRLRKLIGNVAPVQVSFAALAIESATALRQFLAMTQILKHVDADAPIRMLIAECEHPQTVLAALYFARLFGIDDRIDISPLFETEAALEHGGRFLDALLSEEPYRDYVRRRGRVAVQTGFSDAGRFVGQIPAALAIERLQGRLAQAMDAHELGDVSALIFNTHGESMGRGAHPASFGDRLNWPLSPWARSRFSDAGIRLEPEVSFQGGDGYLFFRTPNLALATLARIAEQASVCSTPEDDPFYSDVDLSLDYYRRIRAFQRAQLESRSYARAITAFGLGLLKATGSRVSRRQGAAGPSNLRQIRAIPHNAILQQLGYPVNVIGGAGSAADGELEAVAELLARSDRGRQVVRLLRRANGLASIKTVAAYGELFNSAYWASRPYRGTETGIEDGCLALAEHLINDDRNGVFRRLSSRLRVDWMKLHRLLALLPPDEPGPAPDRARRVIGLLHAIRLALLQHMFLRAAQIPPFSRSNDISREDVLEMVLSLRIDEALAQLRRAYPVAKPRLADFSIDEPANYPDFAEDGYAAVRANFIDRIDQAHRLNFRIATAIANYFGAHG